MSVRPDKSDQKSLNNLMDKLTTLVKDNNEKPKPQKVNEKPIWRKHYRQSRVTEFCQRGTAAAESQQMSPKKNVKKVTSKVRNSKKKSNDQNQKLTDLNGWKTITGKDNESLEGSSVDKVKPVLKERQEKNKTKTGRNTYEKYGMRVPSFESIIKQQKEFRNYKEALNKIQLAEYTALPELLEKFGNDVEEDIEVLDCKTLDEADMKASFLKYCPELRKFMEDKDNRNVEAKLKTSDSKWICRLTSMITFNFEQKKMLMGFLKEEFGERQQLFLRVLLPEVCFRIFMDVHGMNFNKAVKYLESYPIN